MIVCSSCLASYEEVSTRFCGRCGSDMQRRPKGPDPAAAPSCALDPPLDPPLDPMLGRIIDGRYRVLQKVGQGGTGVVYRVEHVAMGKIAAMKVLHPSLTTDEDVTRRFRREAAAVSRLSHPNTVQVFDFGTSAGSLYLVMELVRGEDLGAVLRRDGPLPAARLCPLIVQVCDALSEAHEAGIVHRDLKPENLLVSRGRDGRDMVKVLDFGLAKLRDRDELSQDTARGVLLGTPYYMSPEQIRDEELDARSDLYSLGALMYRLLTGEPPFSATTPLAVLTQHLTEPLVAPRRRAPHLEISKEVDAVVRRAMQKQPSDRFASAEEFKQALLSACKDDEGPLAATPIEDRRGRNEYTVLQSVSMPERLRREDFDAYERRLKQRRWLGLFLVPMLIVLLLAGGAFALFHDPASVVREVELEPNDRPENANAVSAGHPIRGRIGRRLSLEQSDRDFYSLIVRGSPVVARLEVTGIRNLDLKLEIFNEQGVELEASDSGGQGDGEVISHLRISPGRYYIDVREVWVAGHQATENVREDYFLTIDLRPPRDGEKSGPEVHITR